MGDNLSLSGLNDKIASRIFSLWDKISLVDPTDMDHGVLMLLEHLCLLVEAHNGSVLVAVRMDTHEEDPVKGWRPRHVVHLHENAQIRTNVRDADRRFKDGETDITVVRNVAFAGTWRANRLRDLAPPQWFESAFYDQFAKRAGYRDAIWVGCPVNRDLEVYFGLYRDEDLPWYEPEEADRVLVAVRGLAWFLRRYVLSLGMDLANGPLTTTERRVLRCLLRGETQKEISTLLKQSHHTTHDHTKAIYRKFDVGSRAELSALWLGVPERRSASR